MYLFGLFIILISHICLAAPLEIEKCYRSTMNFREGGERDHSLTLNGKIDGKSVIFIPPSAKGKEELLIYTADKQLKCNIEKNRYEGIHGFSSSYAFTLNGSYFMLVTNQLEEAQMIWHGGRILDQSILDKLVSKYKTLDCTNDKAGVEDGLLKKVLKVLTNVSPETIRRRVEEAGMTNEEINRNIERITTDCRGINYPPLKAEIERIQSYKIPAGKKESTNRSNSVTK